MGSLQRISASKVKTYKTCQKQYYYKYVIPFHNRPDQANNVAALMGTALHKAIELKYKDKANPIVTFQTVMRETIDEWEQKQQPINGMLYYSSLLKTGTDILKKFDWSRFEPIGLEVHFDLPFPSPENPLVMVNGIIDLETMDGTIVDHKSTKTKPKQDELDFDAQFLLYSWAYRQIYQNPPYKVIWNHLRTGELLEVNQLGYEEKLEQLTHDIEAMLGNKFYARRNLDSTCRICSFYKLCYPESVPVEIPLDEVIEDI